jgi:hypothetical protein
MKEADSTKAAVTVAEMARMVGLSRARFYQLIQAGVFPEPERQADNSRPFFGENRQKECLEVRRRNYGVNGKAVLFYARRLRPVQSPPKPRTPVTAAASKVGTHDVLLEAAKYRRWWQKFTQTAPPELSRERSSEPSSFT